MLQFAAPPVEIQTQHYALSSTTPISTAYAWLVDHHVQHWADPQMMLTGQTNTEHGGRGVYFKDPAGHGLELITRPYF